MADEVDISNSDVELTAIALRQTIERGGTTMRLAVLVLVLSACRGPIGPQGPPGMNYDPGDSGQVINVAQDFSTGFDFAGTDMIPPIQPKTVTCTPGQSFCVDSAHIATCTLSGADAILGANCSTGGSATNPASCVTTGCPAGQTACCQRQKPLYAWNFTAPALSGQSYVVDTSSTYINTTTTCSGNSNALNFAMLIHPQTTCPSDAVTVEVILDRSKIMTGVSYPLTTPGIIVSALSGAVNCGQWTGTIELSADLPSWSLSIDGACSTTGTALSVHGVMSGNQ